MRRLNEIGERRTSLFVQIYDALYDAIADGIYQKGTMLPSEAVLGETYKVSRVTIRQALALLREDGLVKSVKGKGTIVCGFVQRYPQGLEKSKNPIRTCYMNQADSIEMETSISLATGHLKKKLQRKNLAVMTVKRLYKLEDKLMAFALSYIPVEAADHLKLDLTKQNMIFRFLEKDVYQQSSRIAVNIKLTDTIEFVTEQNGSILNGIVLLYTEDIYFEEEIPYIYNKYYFISPDYKIQFSAEH